MLRKRALTALTISLAALLLATAAGCGGDDPETTQASKSLAEELASTAAGGDADPGPVAGTWSGTLHQKDQNPFPIHVTIRSLTDPSKNPVNYGGAIDCLGNWSFEPDAGHGDTVEFKEVIDRGDGGDCKGRGTVSLTATSDPHAFDYEFEGGGVESSGTLMRTRR